MALFHRPLPRTLEASLRDLEEPNKLVRRSAIKDLARHSREEATDQIVAALLKALRDDDPLVRTEAAYSLGDARARDALPALLMAVAAARFLLVTFPELPICRSISACRREKRVSTRSWTEKG